MELTKTGRNRRMSFYTLHLIFLMMVVECIILAMDPLRFCQASGIPFFRDANPKGVEAGIILWVIGTTLAVVVCRKKIYPYDVQAEKLLWNEPVSERGIHWFLLISIPQLLVSIYLDIYIYFFAYGTALGVLMFLVKLACAVYTGWVLFTDKRA